MLPTKVLIADDHPLIREGVRACIESPNIEVVGEATNGQEAVTLAQSLNPDIIIMDIHMPELTGLEATREIKKKNPRIHVLILSMHDDPEYVREFIDSGAQGYLLKDSGLHLLAEAIQALKEGHAFFSAKVSQSLLQTLRAADIQESPLSKREQEVLIHLARGASYKKAAQQLGIEVSTIKRHRHNILNKLELDTTEDLVKYALKNRLI